MKQLFTCLAILYLITVGCKKSDDVPPSSNTSYAGEYTVTGTETFTTNGTAGISAVKATLFVMQTTTLNRYYFLERYGAAEAGYFVTVDGQNFTGETIIDQTFPDSNRWVGYRTTKGNLEATTITYQSETPSFNILNLGALFNKSQPTTINSMSRKVSYTATKK